MNIYGDEYQSGNDFTSLQLADPDSALGQWHRTGYKEEDLVDYDTQNLKANVAFHLRTKPSLAEQSPELIFANSYSSGTTVFQGDNRFSLKGITFLQNRLEYRKSNKFFIRAFSTRTGAGESYDPYFTALALQQDAKENDEWSRNYTKYWQDNIRQRMLDGGYPEPDVTFDPQTGEVIVDFDAEGARQWLIDNNQLLTDWHDETRSFADDNPGFTTGEPFYQPGSELFQQKFDEITSAYRDPNGDGVGTRFYDNSALYHAHGEYIFTPKWTNKLIVGANTRLYTPDSRGTVFSDTTDLKISNFEFGMYAGIEKSLADNKVKLQATLRADKNENFDWLMSPAASVVYTPSANNFLRVSFSSAIRNPTLADQYLFLNVGRATLSGNLNGVQGLLSIDTLTEFFSTLNSELLDQTFDIDPIRPENVQTLELGYRTTLFEKLYVDASYYYSEYENFIGYNIGADFEPTIDFRGIERLDIFRYSANSKNKVTTQGASLGLSYYLAKKYALNGNYSWNALIKADENDPIIPAFNTPEHKFNLGFSGRDIAVKLGKKRIKNVGFNVNYKWIEGFLFEGSPQFTGFIPSYDMLDAQFNVLIPSISTTLKIGASNILNNKSFQTYGGPRIGRLAYIQFTYQPS